MLRLHYCDGTATVPTTLAVCLEALCMHEYMCSLAQLPLAMRPRLLQLAMRDMAAYVWA
jgi:hypothetical protein